VAAENAATAAAKAEALAGAAPPEEPEPFWSGLATSAAQIKDALAPPVRTGKRYVREKERESLSGLSR
jgi:hypothetical protein